MKLGLISRLSKQIFGSDPPKWRDEFLAAINPFIEKVGLALQNRLTFEDNFLCEVISRKFTDNIALELNPFTRNSRNLRVTGVLSLDAGGLQVDGFKWVQKDNGNIAVTYQFSGGTEANCKVLVLLG